MPERLTTAEAARRLGVQRNTIYAYVSRGLLSSERHIDGKTSTFDADEVDRLRRSRSGGRPGRLDVPVASGITEVVDGSVRYRGTDLGELVADGVDSLDVAQLLWTSTLPERTPSLPDDEATRIAVRQMTMSLGPLATPIDRLMAGVVAASTCDPFRADRSPQGATTATLVIFDAIVEALPLARGARRRARSASWAQRLWPTLTNLPGGQADVLNTALVVLADHGMATSTLAARLAASTRAAPHAVILAALGTVTGDLHGGASRRVHDLLVTAEESGSDAAIAAALAEHGKLPGFGHFIHRTADPRHGLLMDALADSDLDDQRLDIVAETLNRISTKLTTPPNIDMALGALTFCAHMERDAGELIFALARMSGWVAHALEEYEATPLRFRPTGRFQPQ